MPKVEEIFAVRSGSDLILQVYSRDGRQEPLQMRDFTLTQEQVWSLVRKLAMQMEARK